MVKATWFSLLVHACQGEIVNLSLVSVVHLMRRCAERSWMHMFKIAVKITRFFSSRSGKEPSNDFQPPAKRVYSNLTASKTYDSTSRVQKFLPKWENDFPWIQFTEGKMFCKYCLEVNEQGDKNNSFYKSTDKFWIGLIRAHNKSKQHLGCADVYHAKNNPQNPIEQGFGNIDLQCAHANWNGFVFPTKFISPLKMVIR